LGSSGLHNNFWHRKYGIFGSPDANLLPMPIDPSLSYFSCPVDRLPIISMGQSQIISEVRIEKWN